MSRVPFSVRRLTLLLLVLLAAALTFDDLVVPFYSGTPQPIDENMQDTGAILTVTRDADQLFVQVTGQPQAAVYPKNDTEFYYKIVDAQITFETNGRSEAAALVLHQNGRDQRAKRIDDATAKQLEEILEQRVKDQKPFPGSEAMVRRQIDQLQRQQPDFDEFTPEFAEIARPRAEHFATLVSSLGTLKSVTFKRVGPGGFDNYDVKFERGAIDWRILIDGDGKIAGETLQSIP